MVAPMTILMTAVTGTVTEIETETRGSDLLGHCLE